MQSFGNFDDISRLLDSPWFILAVVWGMFWKGLAVWYASQKRQKVWFILLFVLNTFGILEILYLLFVAKAIVEVKVVKEGRRMKGVREPKANKNRR